MNCEHETKTGSGQMFYCDRTATIKHRGKWFCEWCYDLEACGFCETGIQDNDMMTGNSTEV